MGLWSDYGQRGKSAKKDEAVFYRIEGCQGPLITGMA